MGLQHINRLTFLVSVLYLRRESSTWDLRQPLRVTLEDVTSDHARRKLTKSQSLK